VSTKPGTVHLDIFNDVKRHHLNTGVDLLNIPASIYT
jgi:hypothetical protein